MATKRILLRPPAQQHGILLTALLHGPVELRREVVEPAFLKPFACVGVELAVRVEAYDLLRKPRTPNPKRRDAKLHPRLLSVNALVELTYQGVHILAAPIVTRQHATGALIALEATIVGEVHKPPAAVAFLVGIEVVVNVYAVDVIARDDIEDDANGVLTHGQLTWIHPLLTPVLAHQRRTREGHMAARMGAFGARMPRAVWVEPGVQLEAALVRFIHGKAQWIPPRIRGHAFRARQKLGPRLNLAGVERITLRPHLEDDGVQSAGLCAVQKPRELATRGIWREARARWPINVAH